MVLNTPAAPRSPRPTFELTVLDSVWLNPHLVRIRFGGPGFARYQDRPETDKYVKLKFIDADGHDVTRTYTVRKVDPIAHELAIDFVVHGSEGLAGPWAARAQVGATVTMVGPGGGYQPNPGAAWHLFAGDLSAVPAIAAALDALPGDAVGIGIIEIDSADAALELHAPLGMDLRWIVNADHDADLLARELRQLRWREGDVHVFAHGEREAMKAVRRVVFDERGIDRSWLSLSGYWARGRSAERFQAEKRDPIGAIFPEA